MSVHFRIDHKADAERTDRDVTAMTPDPKMAWQVFRNARGLLSRRWQREDNWVVAMELYGVGSTYAFAICRRIGIDPTSRSADRLPPTHPDREGKGGER